MTTVAELLVDRLEQRGVDVVFGIPGVDNLAFFDALEKSSIRCVLVRHEATAGFAADAWFRLTGRPAVCFTTAGPGAANALTPMGEAWASGSTFLHMTTTVAAAYGSPLPPRGLPHYHPYQLAQFQLLACAAVDARDPQAAGDRLDDVLDAMARPPFRPGYFQIPSDLLSEALGPSQTVTDRSETRQEGGPQAPLGARSDPADQVQRAAELLVTASRPIIWAGSGAVSAAGAVLELAEAIGAPVLVTHSAKRGFGNLDHPLVVPYPPHEPPVMAMIEESDVAVVLGSDLDAMMTLQFSLRMPAQIIQVDVEPTHIGMQYPVEVAIVDTVEDFVATLVSDAKWSTTTPRDGRARAASARSATQLAVEQQEDSKEAVRLLAALDAGMQLDCTVVCDMSIAGYWAAGLLNLRANRRLLYPIGWGTLGFGIPAAIGAAIAAPASRTLCITGDAGAAYALGDFATMAQEGLPITVLVVDDRGYGMLRYAGRQRYGRTVASDLAAPDFANVARAFGLTAWSSQFDDADLEAVLATALHHDGPSLVHLRAALNPPRMALLGTPSRK